MPKSLLLAFCLILSSSTAFAQPETINTPVNTPPMTQVNQPPLDTEVSPTRSVQEIWLSLGVLGFGLAVIFAQVFLLSKRDEDESLTDALKYMSVTLIIVGSLFLVTAGYGNEQIAPIIGLLGTVAGYLLGRTGIGSTGNSTNTPRRE